MTRTMAQRMSTAEARKDFANLLRSSERGERIKLTRYNKTVAVLISKHDLDELEECQRRRREVAKVRDGHAKAVRPRLEKPAKRDL
ncbi:MAG: type II toxin-antitoxin system prevent-host-death family antitoxin [Verrucomicrobiota bacterium]